MALELWTNGKLSVVCEDGNVLGAFEAEMQKVATEIANGQWNKVTSATIRGRVKTLPDSASWFETLSVWEDGYDEGFRYWVTLSADEWAVIESVGFVDD